MSLPSPVIVQTPLAFVALPASVTAPTSVDVQLDDCADACDAISIARAHVKVFVVIATPFLRQSRSHSASEWRLQARLWERPSPSTSNRGAAAQRAISSAGKLRGSPEERAAAIRCGSALCVVDR